MGASAGMPIGLTSADLGWTAARQAVDSRLADLARLDMVTLGADIRAQAANDPLQMDALRQAVSPLLTVVQQGELARELSSRGPGTPGVLETRLGNPLWGTRVDGLSAQLRRESELQRDVDPAYSRALAALARTTEATTGRLGDSGYVQAFPPERVSTQSPNPLAIDTISQRNAELTIRDLTARIDENAAEIRRLISENLSLSVQIRFGRGNRAELEHRINDNNERIVALGTDNIGLTLNRTKTINDARLQSSAPENGRIYRALAEGSDPNRLPVIYINGVNTDVNRSSLQAMELSALFRAPVHHVVNVSSMDKMLRVGRDVLEDNSAQRRPGLDVIDQRLQQLMSGNRPAAATAANAILDQLLNSDGKVKVVGYSQGAAIGNEALRMVNDYLRNVLNMSESERIQMLGRIQFLGIGPAAGQRHISRTFAGSAENPGVRELPELRAVVYRTISDRNDPIPALLNVSNPDGSSPDRTSIVRGLRAIGQLATPEGILPHLSYFRSYTATDPGSIYNPEVGQLLHRWYAGIDMPPNTIVEGVGPSRRR